MKKKRIPSSQYIDYQGGKVVTWDMIRAHHYPSEQDRFEDFIDGRTCPMLDDGTAAIYADDYEHWLRLSPKFGGAD